MEESPGNYPVADWDRWAGPLGTRYPGRRWQRYATAEQAGWSSAALVEAERFSREIGSAAVMVVFDGAVLADWGQTSRRYLCHSIRKSLLSALYGEEVANGTIDLDETLGSIGIDDTTPLTEAEKKARVSDLLKSRSGVYLPAAYETPNAKAQRPDRGSHAPGTHWYYNNWDFNVLGTIFNRKTGKDLFVALQRQLAEPLQMQDFELRHGHYHFEPESSAHPAYGLRMSARDLARVGLLYLRQGRWRDGQRLVPASWVEASTRPYSESPGAAGYGYMWWIAPAPLRELGAYAAAGWGGHRVYVIPGTQLVFVHRADTYLRRQVGVPDIRSLIEMILRARIGPASGDPGLVDIAEPAPWKEPPTLTAAEMAALSGEFRQGQARAIVRPSGRRLEIQTPDGRFHLFPRPFGDFEVEDMPHRLEFERDASGAVTGMRIWRPVEMSRVPDDQDHGRQKLPDMVSRYTTRRVAP